MEDFVINRLHAFRTNYEITQQQLADAVDVSRQTIIAIEKGNYTPSVALAIKIARYFDKRVEDIFDIQ